MPTEVVEKTGVEVEVEGEDGIINTESETDPAEYITLA